MGRATERVIGRARPSAQVALGYDQGPIACPDPVRYAADLTGGEVHPARAIPAHLLWKGAEPWPNLMRPSQLSATSVASDQPRETFSRDILPIPDRKHVGLTTYDAKDPDTKYPPIRTLRPPKGAPNVLDRADRRRRASARRRAFGGPCHTPTAERLAKGGLKYTASTPPRSARPRGRRC